MTGIDTAETITGFSSITVGRKTYPVESVQRYPAVPAGYVNGYGKRYPNGRTESYAVRYVAGKRRLLRTLKDTAALS